MLERELKRIVQRQRTILDAAREAGENIDRSSTEQQIGEVARDYESLLRKDATFVPAYVAYGMFLATIDQPERSFAIFKRADAIDGTVAVVKNQLGNHCAETGDFAQAKHLYEEAIRLEPKEALYHYQLGSLLYEYRGHFIDAKLLDREALLTRSFDAFARAAELAPGNLAYVYRHAESYADMPSPDWAEALAVWQSLAQRTKPGLELQTVQLQVAVVLVKLGRIEDARRLLPGITDEKLQFSKQKLIEELPALAENKP
jgi:tetratricopeptide (TPR) repeat protein